MPNRLGVALPGRSALGCVIGTRPRMGGTLVVTAIFFYLILLLMIATPILADRLNKRSARQVPRGPGPGAGGQASPRKPPSGPAGSSRRPVTKAVERRLPRLPLLVRGRCTHGGLAKITPAS
jgi:hypothetical protein